jgi:hypothetical protein
MGPPPKSHGEAAPSERKGNGELAESELVGDPHLVDKSASEATESAPTMTQLIDELSSDGENFPPVDLADMPGLDAVDTRGYAGLTQRIPHDGLLPLIQAGPEDEIGAKPPLGLHGHGTGCKETWATQCSMDFCQVDEQLLLSAVSGNVAKACKESSRNGTSLARHINVVSKRAEEHALCSVTVLAGNAGNSLSVADLETLVTTVDAYISTARIHDCLSYQIDSCMRSANSDAEPWKCEYSSEGKRLALLTETHHASPARVKLIEKWLNACRQRIADIAACNQATIEPPLQYVSYTLKASNESSLPTASSSSSRPLVP